GFERSKTQRPFVPCAQSASAAHGDPGSPAFDAGRSAVHAAATSRWYSGVRPENPPVVELELGALAAPSSPPHPRGESATVRPRSGPPMRSMIIERCYRSRPSLTMAARCASPGRPQGNETQVRKGEIAL